MCLPSHSLISLAFESIWLSSSYRGLVITDHNQDGRGQWSKAYMGRSKYFTFNSCRLSCYPWKSWDWCKLWAFKPSIGIYLFLSYLLWSSRVGFINLYLTQGSRASGAFILTASHNPGGPTEVGYNCIVLFLLSYSFFFFTPIVWWSMLQFGSKRIFISGFLFCRILE